MIRDFKEDDLPEILKLENLSHLVPWTLAIFEQCIKSGCKGHVLEEENVIKGFVLMAYQGGECHILNIMIHPNFQNRGLGKSLLMHALKTAKENKIGIVYLEVRRSNSQAIHLYKNFDFVEIGTRKDYYQTKNGHEDAIIFAKDLTVD